MTPYLKASASPRGGLSVRHMHTGRSRLVTPPHFIIRTRVNGTTQRALGHVRLGRQPQRGKARRVQSNAPEHCADSHEVAAT